MNKYFLPKDVLAAICSFHRIRTSPINHSYQEGIKEIDNFLIRDLLIKQPELNSEYQSLLELLKYHKYKPIETFSLLFQDKIEINNFIEQIFTKGLFFNRESKRLNLFNYILEENADFFNLTHSFLKAHNDEVRINTDSILYNFYFKGLKNKIYKSSIKKEEILDNIHSFDTVNHTKSYKDKLNAYTSIQPKDKELFEYITESMGESLVKNAIIKSLWEEKLNNFPKEIQDNYYKNKVFINPFTESSNYHYIFQVNRQYVIEQSQVVETKADLFNRVLHNALAHLISSKFKTKKRLMDNQPSVEFLFSDIEERNKVQNFCNIVVKDLPSIIKGANFTDHYSEQESYLDNYLNKIYMVYSLNNELNIEQKTTKNKNKI